MPRPRRGLGFLLVLAVLCVVGAVAAFLLLALAYSGISATITQLPYRPSSIGSLRTVWEYDGSAVVGTPYGELWFAALTVGGLAFGCCWLVRRRRRSRARPGGDTSCAAGA